MLFSILLIIQSPKPLNETTLRLFRPLPKTLKTIDSETLNYIAIHELESELLVSPFMIPYTAPLRSLDFKP